MTGFQRLEGSPSPISFPKKSRTNANVFRVMRCEKLSKQKEKERRGTKTNVDLATQL